MANKVFTNSAPHGKPRSAQNSVPSNTPRPDRMIVHSPGRKVKPRNVAIVTKPAKSDQAGVPPAPAKPAASPTTPAQAPHVHDPKKPEGA